MADETRVPYWDHTKAKHAILDGYLGAWYTIIGGAASRGGYSRPAMWYVDWFAGPGRKEEHEGSPFHALGVIQKVLHEPTLKVEVQRCPVLLLDAKRKIVRSLIDAVADKARSTPDVRLHVPGDLGEAASLLKQIGRSHERIPVVCITAPFRDAVPALLGCIPPTDPQFHLIDPHGYSQIPFTAIRPIVERRWAEALINLMVGSMSRFQAVTQFRHHVDAVFGDTEWAEGDANSLSKQYRDRLTAVADDLIVCHYPVEHEGTGHKFYHLVHASHHARAFAAMKEAMWGQSPGISLGFAGRQQRMFSETEPLFNAPAHFLSHDLQRSLANRQMRFDEVVAYVERETRYTGTHARAAMKLLEAEGTIRVTRAQPARKGSFRDDCVVEFG